MNWQTDLPFPESPLRHFLKEAKGPIVTNHTLFNLDGHRWYFWIHLTHWLKATPDLPCMYMDFMMSSKKQTYFPRKFQII